MDPPCQLLLLQEAALLPHLPATLALRCAFLLAQVELKKAKALAAAEKERGK